MLIVLQGRLKSTRLPCKGFFTFFGQTIWERMCDIANDIGFSSQIVFATGDLPENYVAKPLVEKKGVKFFAGSEHNVLQRFWSLARTSESKYIVRITCDNYLVQPQFIEALVRAVEAEEADYGYIDSLSHYSGEVIKSKVLIDQWEKGGASPEALEHVTWDIRNDKRLKHTVLSRTYGGIDHSQSLTLDNVDDFVLMKHVESKYSGLRNIRCVDSIRKMHIGLIER